jgi:hypothetical protein
MNCRSSFQIPTRVKGFFFIASLPEHFQSDIQSFPATMLGVGGGDLVYRNGNSLPYMKMAVSSKCGATAGTIKMFMLVAYYV